MEVEWEEDTWGERETRLVGDDKPHRRRTLGYSIAEGPRPYLTTIHDEIFCLD